MGEGEAGYTLLGGWLWAQVSSDSLTFFDLYFTHIRLWALKYEDHVFSGIFFGGGVGVQPHSTCQILVLRPGIEPVSPGVEAQSPNHWTTREVPRTMLFLSEGWPHSTPNIRGAQEIICPMPYSDPGRPDSECGTCRGHTAWDSWGNWF